VEKVNVNTMVFTEDKYNNDLKAMWRDVGEFIRILITNGYIVSVRDDDYNIIVVEFEEGDPEFGCPTLQWLDPEEFEGYLSYIHKDDEDSFYAKD